MPAPVLPAFIGEALGFEHPQEALHRADVFASLSGPSRPRREEVAGLLPGVRVALSGFFDPGRQSIFGFEVGGGRLGDDFRGSKATALFARPFVT